MGKKQNSMWLTDEVASFLAQRPSQEALLAYRPSARALMRLEMPFGYFIHAATAGSVIFGWTKDAFARSQTSAD